MFTKEEKEKSPLAIKIKHLRQSSKMKHTDISLKVPAGPQRPNAMPESTKGRLITKVQN